MQNEKLKNSKTQRQKANSGCEMKKQLKN